MPHLPSVNVAVAGFVVQRGSPVRLAASFVQSPRNEATGVAARESAITVSATVTGTVNTLPNTCSPASAAERITFEYNVAA